MSGAYLKTLERRAEELETQLGIDARYVELKALRAAIEAHKKGAQREEAVHKPPAAPAQAAPDTAKVPPVVVPEPAGTKGKAAVDAAVALLAVERRYMRSTELATTLMANGVDLSAKSTPQAYLSAHLSNSPLVENIPGHGYGLRIWRHQPENNNEGARH